LEIDYDKTSFKSNILPKCINCGKLSRPNVMMFYDYGFIGDRLEQQEEAYVEFLKNLKNKKDLNLVIIEIGAGEGVFNYFLNLKVPTVRFYNILFDFLELVIFFNKI
jgi:hypothetical protein